MSKAETMILDTLSTMGPRGALISIGALRGKLARSMPAGALNSCLWSLACSGLLNLHGHDYPAGMSAREKSRALAIGSTYYIGAALRTT